MLRLLSLLILTTVIAAPAPLTPRQTFIVEFWGETVNVTRAETILAEEAARLGLTYENYFDACAGKLVDILEFKLSIKEETDLKEEFETFATKMETMKIESKDKVLPIIKEHAPKTYEALSKRLALVPKYLTKLDEASQTFIRNLGDSLLDTVVTLSHRGDVKKMRDLESAIQMVKPMGKIMKAYEALPQSSKDSIERTFCTRSSLRIVDRQGKISAFLTVVKVLAETEL